jgi:biopolymer transport protein ExbB/TolQ
MSVQELLHYLRVGGPTLILILVASFLSLIVAVERLIALWNVGEHTRRLAEAIGKAVLRGDVSTARASAERATVLTADLFRVGFSRLERTGEVTPSLEGAIDRERTQIGLAMKKRLWILGTIGAVTPFVGLFGTVAGIMRSFKDLGLDVGAGGTGGTAAVMSGISEALVATAAGILVAVEAVVLYNYFQARISRLAVELRLIAEEFVELLKERPAGSLKLEPSPTPTPSSGGAVAQTSAQVEGA